MLQEIVKKLKEADEYSVDLETSGLSPFKDRIIGLSLSCGVGKRQEAWYLPFAYSDRAQSFVQVIRALRPIFLDERKTAVWFNGKFDMKFLKKNGVEVRSRFADAQVAAWLLDENRMYESDYFSLKTLAKLDLGVDMVKFSQVDAMGLFQEDFADYAKDDARRTLQLWRKYYPDIQKQDGLEKVFWELKMPTTQILTDMELTGVKLDRSWLQRYGERLRAELKPLEQQIFKAAGQRFLITSSEQVSQVLFHNLNISHEGIPTGKSGGLSTQEQYLEPLKKEHKVIALILKYRGIMKNLSTYVGPLLECSELDGRVHCDFHQVRTATGRLSSSNPNLQNIPTLQKGDIRRAFIAGRGRKLIVGDLNQIELRMMAHRSRDPVMTRSYINDEDLHQLMADKLNSGRPEGKSTNFGFIYLMGAEKFAKRQGYSESRAWKFKNTFFETYIGVKKYHNKVRKDVMRDGYVKTIFGRPRRFDVSAGDPDGHIYRQAVNSTIQSSCADMFELIMKRYVKELNERARKKSVYGDVKLVIQVHDELVIDSPEEVAKESGELLKEVMENSIKLRVPVKADISIGNNWSECKG